MSTTVQNISALTHGPDAAADPCVSVYNGQQHIAYRDSEGLIWDSWYDGQGQWNLQRINGVGGITAGPAAIAGPFIGLFHQQQHFAYVDGSGIIWDSWYDGQGNWKLQEINFLASNDSPAYIDPNPGAPGPTIAVWTDPGNNSQQHFTYRTTDPFRIMDIFWDSDPLNLVFASNPAHWTHQLLIDEGVTPASSPVVGGFGSQQHVVYMEEQTGLLVDHWYDGNLNWNFQRLTGGLDAKTDGPPMLSSTLPAVWLDETGTQQHFTYVGVDRAIYDAFWNGSDWQLQKLTLSGLTDGPSAWNSPSVCNYQPSGSDNAVYVAYRDQFGTVWTVAYMNGQWKAFQLKDLPFGVGASPAIDIPLAAGNVSVWVDSSGNQVHFTFLGQSVQRPNLPPMPAGVLEEGVLPLDRRTLASSADSARPAGLAVGPSGVIWDVFYQP